MFETDVAGLLGSAAGIAVVVAVVATLVWLYMKVEDDNGWAAIAFVALVGPFTIGIPIYMLLALTGIV
jgi:heme/copper-type cytochrome/quinol oxidase subunit 4